MNSNLFLKKEYRPWLTDIKFISPIWQQAVSQLSAEQKIQQLVDQIAQWFISHTVEVKVVGFKPEYALSDINKPIDVSKYRLTESIPDTFKGTLPTIEQIEAELGGERG
jgi:hypothetical protein